MKAIFLLFVVITGLISIEACNLGTGVGEKKETPKEFLNTVAVEPVKYLGDSTIIYQQIRKFLVSHDLSFYNQSYFDSTILLVDTIIYNKEQNKVSVFVVTKNPTYRQLDPDKEHTWYYDAYCYLGARQNDTFNLKWLRPFSAINFYDEKEASDYLKQQYFTEFNTLKDAEGNYVYKYNLNDKRFWDSEAWEKNFRSK